MGPEFAEAGANGGVGAETVPGKSGIPATSHYIHIEGGESPLRRATGESVTRNKWRRSRCDGEEEALPPPELANTIILFQ